MDSYMKLQLDVHNKILRSKINYKKTPKERFSRCYVETRLENLERLWKNFCETDFEIVSKIKQEDIDKSSYLDLYDRSEEEYTSFKCDLKSKLLCLVGSGGDGKESKQESSNNNVLKLPKISLPVFDGDYSKWVTFRDLFLSLVHNNRSIDDVQKLHYLKTQLTGEAEQLLRHIPVTSSNYNICWSQLNDRYNNTRYLANCILKKFMNQKNLTVESSGGIKDLLDTTTECLSGLENLQVDVSNWDLIVIYIVSLKLDSESRRLWEAKVSETFKELPTLANFKEFLQNRFRSLEFLDSKVAKPSTSRNVKSLHVTVPACTYCNEDHKIANCKKFAKLDVNARRDFVQSRSLCYNCLGLKHSAYACRQSSRCKICQKRHHSLLHPKGISQQVDSVESGDAALNEGVVSNGESIVNCFSKMPSQVLLATALVKVESKTGVLMTLRSLLDQGSQASFITEAAVQLLGLKKFASRGLIAGLGSDQTGSLEFKSVVYFKIQSLRNPQVVVSVKAHVLNEITAFLPGSKVSVQPIPGLTVTDLADPTFNVPNKIDILLGAEIYGQIIEEGIIKGPPGFPTAQKTSLGWILSGQIYAKCHQDKVVSMHTHYDMNELLRKFWELESESYKKHLTPEESRCEEIYSQTTARNNSGRYIVKLPFRDEDPSCKYGNSREIAAKRFHGLERKLLKNPELKVEYIRVLQEYLDLGHMELVPEAERFKQDAVYLPHHAVVREDKASTKVRVVFDASCPGVNGVSLNNDLMVGPTLQSDLRSVIMRWRIYPICLTSDIVKMYRQVQVYKTDSDFQRILWRNLDEPNSDLQTYRLLTVTFGTSSAPYLAVRTLQQLAHDDGVKYPLVSERVLRDFYVDDLMTGCNSVEEGKAIFREMNALLKGGGFQLQRWSSNSEELLEDFRTGSGEQGTGNLEIKTDPVVKILGLTWNRQFDAFVYSVNLPPLNHPVTKRKVISDIARLFDPLGWIAPTIIIAKILIQKLWLSGIDWDDELPPQLMEEWIAYRAELVLLTGFKIPRWVNTGEDVTLVELHGFCDASNDAYAAVIYIRVVKLTGTTSINLLTSKTKVSPIKQVSIPRLELCGAVLVAKLLQEVSHSLNIPKSCLHAWTDSTVVLAWLSSHPSRWKTFVANRVSDILNVLDSDQWHHVQSMDNPADCASRGVRPSQYPSNDLWLKGPSWLQEREINYNNKSRVTEINLEERAEKFCCMTTNDDFDLWDKFSSLTRLVRVVALCRRFLYLRKSSGVKFTKWISSQEISQALNVCIKKCQTLYFREELENIAKIGRVNKKSKLTSLNPFIDDAGILRVGGRLQLLQGSEDMKHPILLPHKSSLTELLIREAHDRTLHGGPQLMVNYLRTKYWIIQVKSLAKLYVRNCVTCIRYASRPTQQLMGQLPSARVTACRPFLRSGVDYAGPISIRSSKGRGHHSHKGYICLFVCMVTRAVHLEAVTDLTAQGFLAAFKRFVARRGHCAEVWSDNGTNFVGAAKELKSLFQIEKSSIATEIAEALALSGTSWHFIPPRAPNFGGLWEAGIKSTKHHFRRVIGDTTLTFEEITTVLAQIEACLNSRPISQMSDDSNDPSPLTPGHFLIGEPLVLAPEANYEQSNISCLRRWQLTQKMVQHFWKRWSAEYLTHFLQRHKWAHIQPEPKLGDVVLVKEDDLPPARWLFGVIVNKHPGVDKVTRVVSLRCNGKVIKRPTSKLCILPVAK